MIDENDSKNDDKKENAINKKKKKEKSDKWYVRKHGDQRIGPIPYKEVMALINDGILGADTYVWNEADGFNEWVSVDQIQELNIQKSQIAMPLLPELADELRWFVINQNKEKIGPMHDEELLQIIKENDGPKDKMYAWNGRTVKKWTPLSQVEEFLQLKPSNPTSPQITEESEQTIVWWYAANADKTKFGPMWESELIQKVNDSELTINSLVFNADTVKEWTRIRDVDELGQRVLNQLPPHNDRWYMQDANGNAMGPFDTLEIIKAFKEDKISEKTLLQNGKSIKNLTAFENISYLVDKLGIDEDAKEKEVTQNWYVRDKHGKKQGPMDHNRLLKALKDGMINNDSLIYHKDKTGKWVKLKDNDFIGIMAQKYDFKAQNKRIKKLKKRVFAHRPKPTYGWYVEDKDKDKIGPMNSEKVEQMFDDDQINYNSMVFHENVTGNWIKFKKTSMAKKKRRENRHFIESEDESSSTMLSVVLEVDNHVHRRFMDAIADKRAQIFRKRIRAEKKKKRQRMKMLMGDLTAKQRQQIKLPKGIKIKKTVHDDAADVAISWRTNNNLGAMEEIFGNGTKKAEVVEEMEQCQQTNVTIHRIERICAAMSQFVLYDDEQSDDSVLIDRVDDLVFEYFRNGRKFLTASEDVSQRSSQSSASSKSSSAIPVTGNIEEDVDKIENDETEKKIFKGDIRKGNAIKAEDMWFVTDTNKKRTGPITWTQLVSLYTLNEINEDCYVYHKQYSVKWAKINKSANIFKELQKYKGNRSRQSEDENEDKDIENDADSQWFALDISEKKFGPMTFDDLAKLYQDWDKMNSDCRIWNIKHVKRWTKISALPDIEKKLKEFQDTDRNKADWFVLDIDEAKNGPLSMNGLLILKEKKLINQSCAAWKNEDEKPKLIQNIPVLMNLFDGKLVDKTKEKKSTFFELREDDERFTKHKWFAADKHKNRYGPMSFEELGEIYCIKKIDKNSLVYNGKSIESWTKIKKIKDLFKRLQGSLS